MKRNQRPKVEQTPNCQFGNGSNPSRENQHFGSTLAENSVPRLLDLKAAETYSGLPYWTLYVLTNKGIIPVVRIPDPYREGRYLRRIWISREALDKFIEKQETRGKNA